MKTILLEDVLHSLDSTVAIMKIDVESMECKVCGTLHPYYMHRKTKDPIVQMSDTHSIFPVYQLIKLVDFKFQILYWVNLSVLFLILFVCRTNPVFWFGVPIFVLTNNSCLFVGLPFFIYLILKALFNSEVCIC